MIVVDQRRPVKGFPGYTVTPDGTVYSTNKSRNGMPKTLGGGDANPDRRVKLCRGAQVHKYRRVVDLVLEAWGTRDYFDAANKAKEAEQRGKTEED